jgi:hypothetical protein
VVGADPSTGVSVLAEICDDPVTASSHPRSSLAVGTRASLSRLSTSAAVSGSAWLRNDHNDRGGDRVDLASQRSGRRTGHPDFATNGAVNEPS